MKLPTILLSIAGGGLALLAWSQTWFEATLAVGAGANAVAGTAIPVSGQVASPAISALALAALALAGALAIASFVIRMFLGALGVVLGGSIVLAAWIALADPVAAVAPAVTDATGVAGAGPTAELVALVSATAWPWVAFASGVLVIASGVLALVTGIAWPGSTRRYADPVRKNLVRIPTRAQIAADEVFAPRRKPDDAIDDWDDLSRGDDPTDDGRDGPRPPAR
jgi:hypothetical protein